VEIAGPSESFVSYQVFSPELRVLSHLLFKLRNRGWKIGITWKGSTQDIDMSACLDDPTDHDQKIVARGNVWADW
jgi:hypothetical protein